MHNWSWAWRKFLLLFVLKKEVKYLDHVVSAEGWSCIPIRQAQWKIVQSKTNNDVQRFLRFCSYYILFNKLLPLLNYYTSSQKTSISVVQRLNKLQNIKNCIMFWDNTHFSNFCILHTNVNNRGCRYIVLQVQNGEEKVTQPISAWHSSKQKGIIA